MPFCSLLLQGEELSRRGMKRPGLMVLRVDLFFFFFFLLLGWKAWELFLSNCFQMVLLEHKDF